MTELLDGPPHLVEALAILARELHLQRSPGTELRLLHTGLRRIRDDVLAQHRVSLSEFISPRRHPDLIAARREFVRRCWEETTATTTEIGLHIGHRDQSTIRHALRAVGALERRPAPTTGALATVPEIIEAMTGSAAVCAEACAIAALAMDRVAGAWAAKGGCEGEARP